MATTTEINARSSHDDDGKSDLEAGQIASTSGPVHPGVAKMESARKLWTGKYRALFFFSIVVAVFTQTLDGTTSPQYLAYATSLVLEHSLSGTVVTATYLTNAVASPVVAKLSDVFGRGELLLLTVLCFVVGNVVQATANSIGAIAAGQVINSAGTGALSSLLQIIIGDTTTLRWRSLGITAINLPAIITNLLAAEIVNAVLPDWRWGWGMLAILYPVTIAPILVCVLWAQRRAKKLNLPGTEAIQRPDWRTVLVELDALGLLLLTASVVMILIPITLGATAAQGWNTPYIIVLLTLGCILLVATLIYETRVASFPVIPFRFFRNRAVTGTVAIVFFNFLSLSLVLTYQYPFVSVIKDDWSLRELSYYTSIWFLTGTVFSILGGLYLAWRRRFKTLMIVGCVIRTVGTGVMIHSRGAEAGTFELVFCLVLVGLGDGLVGAAQILAAQVAVPHNDLAIATAFVILMGGIGAAIGSATATSIWTTYMPRELAASIPDATPDLVAELFGSIVNIISYEPNSPIRLGAIAAYEHVMLRMLIAGTVFSFPALLAAVFLIEDHELGDVQNVVEREPMDGDAKQVV